MESENGKYVKCRDYVVFEVVLEPLCDAQKVVLTTRNYDFAKITLEHYLELKKYDDVAIRKVVLTRYTFVED